MNPLKTIIKYFLIILFAISVSATNGLSPSTGNPDQDIPLDGRGGGIIAYSITSSADGNQIFIIDADGSGQRQIGSVAGRACGPDWSANGSQIAFYNHFNDETWSVFTMNADGGNVKQITSMQNVWDGVPRWSPDGASIVFGRTNPKNNFKSEIWIVNADGTNPRRIGAVTGNGPYWSKDGKRILYFSSKGRGTEIHEMRADGTATKQLTNLGAEIYWPKYSPDDSKIAFESNKDGDLEIYVMNADGSKITQLTFNEAEDGAPEWSPDGQRIVFVSQRDGHYELYVMNADGSAQTRLTATSVHAIQPDWKPSQCVNY